MNTLAIGCFLFSVNQILKNVENLGIVFLLKRIYNINVLKEILCIIFRRILDEEKSLLENYN